MSFKQYFVYAVRTKNNVAVRRVLGPNENTEESRTKKAKSTNRTMEVDGHKQSVNVPWMIYFALNRTFRQSNCNWNFC